MTKVDRIKRLVSETLPSSVLYGGGKVDEFIRFMKQKGNWEGSLYGNPLHNKDLIYVFKKRGKFSSYLKTKRT